MKTILFKRAEWPSITGTGLVGHVYTTYGDLVNVFGPPAEGSADGKTTATWIIEFSCGTVVSIYDWKEGATPKGPYLWHVGGKSHRALELVAACLEPSQHVVDRTPKLTALFI